MGLGFKFNGLSCCFLEHNDFFFFCVVRIFIFMFSGLQFFIWAFTIFVSHISVFWGSTIQFFGGCCSPDRWPYTEIESRPAKAVVCLGFCLTQWPSNVDIADMLLSRYDIIQKMPVFWSRIHPYILYLLFCWKMVIIILGHVQSIGIGSSRSPLAFILPVPWCPMAIPRTSLLLPTRVVKSSSKTN